MKTFGAFVASALFLVVVVSPVYGQQPDASHGPRHPDASRASAASVRPTTGANLKPWPEQADPTTTWPWRSRTKLSSAVLV